MFVSAFPLKYPVIHVTHILFIDPIMVYIRAVDFKTWRLELSADIMISPVSPMSARVNFQKVLFAQTLI